MSVDTSVDGVHSVVPTDQYHADITTLSASGAKLLLPPSTPAHFRWRRDNPAKPKKHFDVGHAVHRVVLGEGEELAVLDPEIHGLKKDGAIAENPAATAGWKDAVAKARANGEVPIHIDDYRTAIAMAQAVHEHPEAHRLLASGDAEVSLYARDPVTDVRLRGRPDWLTYRDGRLWIVDYKTAVSANPEVFRRKAYDFGYHVQFAWYVALARLLELDESPAFVFVVQEKDPPFLPSVVELDADAFGLGCRHMAQAIHLFADCTERGEWPGYGDDIVPISLPPWAFTGEPTISDLIEAK